jgi:hypothetical protein
MEVADIVMFVLKGALYASSSAALIALCIYIFLACRGDSTTLLSTINARRMNWKSNLLLGLASTGFLICMFQGAEAMLFWTPDSWGQLDEDREFHTFRSSLAATFAGVGGLALICFLDQATRDRTLQRVLTEQIEGERKIHTAKSLARLDALKSDFEGKIEELEGKVPRDTWGEEPLRIEYLQIRAYRALLSIIETRTGAIHAQRATEAATASDGTGKKSSPRGPKDITSASTREEKDLLIAIVDRRIESELANIKALVRLEAPGIEALKSWVKKRWREDVLPGAGVEALEGHGLAEWMEEGLEELLEKAFDALMEERREALEALGQEMLKEVAEDIAAGLMTEHDRRRARQGGNEARTL